MWNSASSQLETPSSGLDSHLRVDSIHEALHGILSSPPVDGGTKHSGSRHASRRLRARAWPLFLKVGFAAKLHNTALYVSSLNLPPRFKSNRIALLENNDVFFYRGNEREIISFFLIKTHVFAMKSLFFRTRKERFFCEFSVIFSIMDFLRNFKDWKIPSYYGFKQFSCSLRICKN